MLLALLFLDLCLVSTCTSYADAFYPQHPSPLDGQALPPRRALAPRYYISYLHIGTRYTQIIYMHVCTLFTHTVTDIYTVGIGPSAMVGRAPLYPLRHSAWYPGVPGSI